MPDDPWFIREVHPHEAMLRSWLTKTFPDLCDVDDVIQDAYLKVCRLRENRPIRTLLSGEEAARGFEVDLQLQLTENWQALIGYSYLDTEIVSNDDAPAQEGEPFPGVFDQTFKAWTKYTFTDGILDGLSINGGLTSVPERTSSFFSDPDDPRQTYEAYTRIDAGLSYAWETEQTRYKLSFHVQNLTDDIYPETTLRLGPPLTWFVRLDVGL